ncbi:Protein of unknown function [Gryllus bimaculatus]|nr:Protein of unknown function [Gryllus bimaculatus]
MGRSSPPGRAAAAANCGGRNRARRRADGAVEAAWVLAVPMLLAPAVWGTTETKLSPLPTQQSPGRDSDDLSTSGSVMYPYHYPMAPYGGVHPLTALALLAAHSPPAAPAHPLLLASLMGGAPVLPPAAGTASAAAAAAAASAPVTYVGAGQGHNPLLAYLLAQYMRHQPYGAVNYSLPGYSASNNVHNSKAFGAYKYEDRH